MYKLSERKKGKQIMKVQYKGYEIRKSGKTLFRIVVVDPNNCEYFTRFRSIEACKAVIDADSEHRIMTPAEHALVYGAS